ncbi:MAG: hypothetical protein HC782_02265 [Gammaproteobacteria bacterium]|nr:hypothetical protein [Gammaproteobacteria bacterium]
MIQQGGIDSDGDGFGEVLIRRNSTSMLGRFSVTDNKLVFVNAPDPGASMRILGIGDFGARGRSDLLLQNSATGDTRFWINFDGFVDSLRLLRNVKPGWVVEAVADMDGDGRSDIVWRYVGSPINPPTNPMMLAWYCLVYERRCHH